MSTFVTSVGARVSRFAAVPQGSSDPPERSESVERAEAMSRLKSRDPLHTSLGSRAASSVRVIQAKKKKNGKGRFPVKGHDSVRTYRSVLPDEQDVVLPYVVEGELTNNGLAFASVRFQANGCFDPDPLIGGASYLALSEWASLYNFYRVISYTYELTICNREAFPMFVDLYNTNTDPGATVGTNGLYFAMNAFGKSGAMGPLTGGRETLVMRGKVPLAALFGSENVETSPLFQGISSSANPPELVYIGFNTRSAVPQTTAGAYYQLKLHAHVRFYDRVLLTI